MKSEKERDGGRKKEKESKMAKNRYKVSGR